jgi:glucose/arabinose dehydrogenase
MNRKRLHLFGLPVIIAAAAVAACAAAALLFASAFLAAAAITASPFEPPGVPSQTRQIQDSWLHSDRPPSPAQTWPQISLQAFASGFSSPVHVTHAGDGSGRLFVVEKEGRIRIVKNGVLSATPFLAIEDRVLSSGSEQGLLCVAFPPGYASKGYFYVNYTRLPDGATVVSRFRTSADPDLALPGSEEPILLVPQPFANHNGGQMAFGPKDGYLYIGMGDGGSGGDPFNNAQNPAELLGKLLRLDPESGAAPYAVPPSNPYRAQPGFRPEIWALGLRNPWRFSFDRLTGDLFIADVGQNIWEEIDVQPASSPGGENYGWRIWEGAECYDLASGCPIPARYAPPVFSYDHNQGCSVTGGSVYRGELHPEMQGIYFFGDFCSGMVWGLRRGALQWENALLVDTTYLISTFGEDEKGNIYLADYRTGSLYLLASERVKSGRIRR